MAALSPLLLLWLATAAADAPSSAATGPVSVQATASKAELALGEPFTLELKAAGPAGTRYTFLGEASDDSFALRTTSAGAAEKTPPPEGVHRYQAAVFALGQAVIPPIPVSYRLPDGTTGEARSQPLTLKVVSTLPRDPQQQKLADIRGPLAVSIAPAFWLALALSILLAGAAAAWLLRRRGRRRAPQTVSVPELPADAEALRALDALAGSGLLAAGEYRAFYIRLTEVAKRYLERRLSAPVLEMTTAETLAFLRGHPVAALLLAAVRDLAEAADRIKFARGEGLAAEAKRHLAAVRALVQELEERLRPPEAPAEGKAA